VSSQLLLRSSSHTIKSSTTTRAKLDTVSKAKYGTWIQELGGWTVLQVR